MKQYMALLGSVMFCVVCFSLYLMLETSTGVPGQNPEIGENDLSSIEAKIKRIEIDLRRNHKTINLIKDTVRDIANGDTQSLTRLQKALAAQGSELFLPGELKAGSTMRPAFNISGPKKMTVPIPQDMCALAQRGTETADIQMREVFKLLPFDNLDGGVWKQGYPLSYSERTFSSKPLLVFVVPHSHNDPGWIKTFERYYQEQTRHILDNMVDKLEKYEDLRFIYAEMSFFSMWWNEISEEKRERTKKLLQSKRLEIVSGGWVMPDEANTHYFAMIDQLIEGNQWLLNQAGVTPTSGWAIDPFGHTPTMAYILKRANFDNMLIQRTHYAVKRHLSKKQQLEFYWRQIWDERGSTDMLCHMMPFYSYDVPHTCGPNPQVCCQFDFKRLPGGRISCPWRVPPVVIGEHNIEERAKIILDQWKKKSTLYKNNVVLVPLGDDFRYDKPAEWDQQYTNYKKLFDHMNSRTDWNVKARFGTLSDYFGALRDRAGAGAAPSELPAGYPSLSGDFFSYSDRDDHYWSGYYTSRPFYKHIDRVLEYHLRSAEISYSMALAYVRRYKLTAFPTDQMMNQIVSARRALGLFQHHDGITGTAKDQVVVDYGIRMLKAMINLKDIIRHSASFLLTKDKVNYVHRGTDAFIDMDEKRSSHDALAEPTVMITTIEPRPVVLYNSLAHKRSTVVRLHTNTPWVELRGPDGDVVPTQVVPVWQNPESMLENSYQIVFVATVPALGFTRYLIRRTEKNANKLNVLTRLFYFNGRPTNPVAPFSLERQSREEDFSIENDDIRAAFSWKTAMLDALTLKATDTTVNAKVQFLKYGTNDRNEKSGAYLFLPDREAVPLSDQKAIIRIHRGPILSAVYMFLPNVQHVVTLVNSPGIDSLGVDIYNLVDIRNENNFELIMRVNTGIENMDKVFYTDLNGFQIIRRQTFSKLTLQGNFYPMPTTAYIQDSNHRFTILTGQSLGVASLNKGELEVVQDRSLVQDDNRGLGQGVTDNKRTPNVFRFILEKHVASAPPLEHGATAGFLSVTGTLSSRELLHPIAVLPATSVPNPPSVSMLHATLAPLSEDLPCELHLLNLRTMQQPEKEQRILPQDTSALLLHHTAFDCALPSKGAFCSVGKGTVLPKKIFKDIQIHEAKTTSLTLTGDMPLDITKPYSVPPMEIATFKVKLG